MSAKRRLRHSLEGEGFGRELSRTVWEGVQPEIIWQELIETIHYFYLVSWLVSHGGKRVKPSVC